MKKTKSNSKMAAKKRSRRSKRSGRTTSQSGQILGAPAGVSGELTQFTKFIPSSGGAGVSMHALVALCEVAAVPAVGSDRQALVTGGTAYSQAASLGLTNLTTWDLTAPAFANWLSPIFDLIASAFVRYRVRKCKFYYRPQSTTTQAGRLVFGFAEDPNHPLIYNPSVLPSSLLAVADSIPFAPWASWELDVSRNIRQDLLYTYAGIGYAAADEAAVNRFSNFGIIGLVTDQVGNAVAVTSGVLYAEMIVDLVEFCPVTSTFPALTGLEKGVMKQFRVGLYEHSIKCIDLGKATVRATFPPSKECTINKFGDSPKIFDRPQGVEQVSDESLTSCCTQSGEGEEDSTKGELSKEDLLVLAHIESLRMKIKGGVA